jgi:TatD DNase family protein
MIDVHTHIVETPESYKDLESIETNIIYLMSCKRSEWGAVCSLASDRRIPAFGIHPWFVHEHSENDLIELKSLLQQFPQAIVGEIGLDAIAVDRNTGKRYDMERQKLFFAKQMEIATELHRPVSVHNVKSHGALLDYFRKMDRKCHKLNNDIMPCPPAIMLHSFSASVEIASALIKLPSIGRKFYFSFSNLVNGRSPGTPNRIRAIPEDRILIESDCHDTRHIDEALCNAVSMVAEARMWDNSRTVQICTRNAIEFLKRIKS